MEEERLFLGLHIWPLFKDEIRDFIYRVQPELSDHKWVIPENIHITIHFFGSVSLSDKPKIFEAIKPIVEHIPPFDLALEEIGFFPKPEKPRVIWWGVNKEAVEPLNHLYKQVTNAVSSVGFSVEHDHFTPHASFMRVKKEHPLNWGEEKYSFKKSSIQTINELFLFKSMSTPKGVDYVAQEKFSFRGVKK